MFKELNDIEEYIKGNKDLRKMEDLMSVTNEAMSIHTKAYEDLRTKIVGINMEAEKAVMSLSFYDDGEKPADKKKDLQLIQELEEDDSA